MSRRPMRQFYAHDRCFSIEGLAPSAETFRRHRSRFLDALASLTDAEWTSRTRCDAWNAEDVAAHLVSADGFWALTIQGRGSDDPTTFLRGFDPATSPEAIIAPTRGRGRSEVMSALEQSTATLLDALDGVAGGEWGLVSESPFGHMPVSVIAAHALWDSWLHERDVLVPLGQVPPVEPDELMVVVAFTLFAGGAQGGLLDDPEPVGDGPTAPVDAAIRFDELPETSFRLRVDRDVVVTVEGRDDGSAPAGGALDLVEAFAGRAPIDPVMPRLPDDVAAQLARAHHFL